MKGKLYICPTPIGNLGDITLRTIETLKTVDLIGAEDTRRSIKLLNHFKIRNKLTSYHEHNEKSKGDYLIAEILAGKDVAIISDAGMPGISDPGEEIIKKAIENSIDVVALPGATASITALVLSGLSTDRFIFEGFLPAKNKEKKEELERISKNKYTSIIYESPHRIKESLKLMDEILPGRKISLSRELSKKYEETLRGSSGEILKELELRPNIKGEFVIIIEGNKEDDEPREVNIREELVNLVESGYSKSQAVKKVSKKFGLGRNKVYEESLTL